MKQPLEEIFFPLLNRLNCTKVFNSLLLSQIVGLGGLCGGPKSRSDIIIKSKKKKGQELKKNSACIQDIHETIYLIPLDISKFAKYAVLF